MLSEVKGDLHEPQMISFRKQIWLFAVNLLYEFCLQVNIDYFQERFKKMRFLKEYEASCYRILNDYPEKKWEFLASKFLLNRLIFSFLKMIKKRIQQLSNHLEKKF